MNFEPVKITDRVYWVGAIDWNIRDFHGYLTSRGTTYNAFLILGKKNVLIDTVKSHFKDEMLARIAKVMDPAKIDIIVSNHSELDHSGCLPEVIKEVKPEAVYASKMGVKALTDHFNTDLGITEAKDGSTLYIGGLTLTFYETRMLHWPDSMFTLLNEEKILFTQDGFGMHLATEELFDDQLDLELLISEAAKYYANILLPYSPIVMKFLPKLQELLTKVDTIAPDHGPIWRTHPSKVVDKYVKWASGAQTLKTIIIYDSMWGSTAKMANAIAEGVKDGGAEPKLLSLKEHHRSDVATEILEAGAMLVGSPTLNTSLYPTIADVLSYIEGLRPTNLIGAAFGSYGWNSKAVELVEEWLQKFKVELALPGLKVKYVPANSDLEQCRDFGKQIALKLKAKGI